MKESEFKRYSIARIQLVALSVIFLYVLGLFFPSLFWTTHSLAFLPSRMGYLILLLSVFILFAPDHLFPNLDFTANITLISIVILSGCVMYNFPIVLDHYGDSYKFVSLLEKVPSVIPPKATDALFSFNFETSSGQDTILAIVTYLAYFFQVSYAKAFLYLDVFCGMAFVLLWLLFIRAQLVQSFSRVLMALAGIVAPFLLNFFGHQEIYAPIFLVHAIWLIVLIIYTQNKSSGLLYVLCVLFILCLKLHGIAILFFPVLGLCVLQHLLPENERINYLLSWKGIIYCLFIPLFLIGLFVYFFLLEDYTDSRTMRDEVVQGIDRLFLPLLSPEAPLDRYNLFSKGHLFDFILLPFLWSPIALFVLLYIGGTFRKLINWEALSLKLVSIVFLLFCALFFVVNPLLSLPIDWDLFSLPAIPLLVLTVLLMKQIEKQKITLVQQLHKVGVSIAVLVLPFFVLHSSTAMSAERYKALGIRIYNTYYEWASSVLIYATYNSSENPDEQAEFRQGIINKMEPGALLGNDYEFSQLLTDQGKYYLRTKKQGEKSLVYFNDAERYYPNDENNWMALVEAYFFLKRYDEALKYTLKLASVNFPNEKKDLAMVIHCSIKAKQYDTAKTYAEDYLNKWRDPTIIEIHRILSTGKNLKQLDTFFKEE